MASVMRTISLAASVGRFCWRHKRLTLAAAVGLLIVLSLLSSSGGTFFLNPVFSTEEALIGPGIAALVVRRIARVGVRNRN